MSAASSRSHRSGSSGGSRRDDRSPIEAGAGGDGLPALLTIAVLIGIMGRDVMRIGFFADDFHFLDVARRIPFLQAVDGANGIFPWYRPLSREFYFELVARAGSAGLFVAHALSLLCVALCAWNVRAIAIRVSGVRTGAIAPILFLTYAITKFLAAWPSGFQDLLALLLVVLAVRSQMEGLPRRAAIWAFLALFAKETAVVVFPILALEAWSRTAAHRRPAWSWWQVASLSLAVAVHVAIRMSWHTQKVMPHLKASVPDLADALGRVLGGFAGIPASLQLHSFWPAAVVMSATGLLLATLPPTQPEIPSASGHDAPVNPSRRLLLFLGGAILFGLSPLVLGHLSAYARPQEYYAYSAAPWFALALAIGLARLPRVAGSILLVALAGWNTLALSYAPVDLTVSEGWRFDRWDWPEAIRLSAKADRLAEDLRANLSARPESLVVLLCGMENGSFFQTEDGPATRESLHDPTVRAYWLYQPPYPLRPGKFEILAFNLESRHLERHTLAASYRYELAANALAAGRSAAAWALASYGDSIENSGVGFRYLRMGSALIEEGPAGARRELRGFGQADAGAASAIARAAAPEGPGAVPDATLQQLLDPGTHLVLAAAGAAKGSATQEAIELRLATTLDPNLIHERLRLDRLLLEMDERDAALEDLRRLAARTTGTPLATETSWILSHAEQIDAAKLPRPNPH